MKHIALALTAFAAAFSVASCQKEIEVTGTQESPMIINAIAEGVNSPTKAELAYKYDILWQSGDEICVQNGSTNSVFTLVSGAGTTEGTFEGDASLTGEVKAVYPASLVSGEDYTWPAVQTTDLVVPLYKPHI